MIAHDMMSHAKLEISSDYGVRASSSIFAELQRYLLSGERPYSCHESVPLEGAELVLDEVLGPNYRIVRRSTSHRRFDNTMACSKNVAVVLEVTPRHHIDITVCAPTLERAREVLADIKSRLPVPDASESLIPIKIWYLTNDGADDSIKRISVPSWTEISRNYPEAVADNLARLMTLNAPSDRGKIVLWHGAPGTGKTTALRALAREWKEWCSVHYITDPERFFSNPAYLLAVAGEEMSDPDTGSQRWQLVVAEDSDEFMRASARADAGAALGRLLNFSDGILGQGCNTLILLTTNEEIETLHPAITRPGRCLSQIHFEKFSGPEATAWAADGTHFHAEKTLAELIEHRAHGQINHCKTDESTGMYL